MPPPPPPLPPLLPPPAHPPLDAHALFSELVADVPPVDLTRPPSPPLCDAVGAVDLSGTTHAADDLDDVATDPDSAPHTPSLKRRAPPSSPEQRRRDHHNTHTRRCRARLNWRFDALNRMLPHPYVAGQVKHKVHILDHAIAALTALRAENDHLRLLVALRSPPAVARWVAAIVPSAPSAALALRPVLDLLAYAGAWVYAEVWQLRTGTSNCNKNSKMTVGIPGMSLEAHLVQAPPVLQTALQAVATLGGAGGDSSISTSSRATSTVGNGSDTSGHGILDARCDFAGGALLRGRATWARRCVDACLEPRRAQLLAAARVRTCLAVPVAVDGESTHVVALYDVRERDEEEATVEFATFVVAAVGNCFGARVGGDEGRREGVGASPRPGAGRIRG